MPIYHSISEGGQVRAVPYSQISEVMNRYPYGSSFSENKNSGTNEKIPKGKEWWNDNFKFQNRIIAGMQENEIPNIKEDRTLALWFMIEENDINRLKPALQENSDIVHWRDWSGQSPLHVAAAHGHCNILELLLSHGADIGATDNCGIRPLHEAAEAGMLLAVEFLLNNGAPIEAMSWSIGWTPLHHAVFHGHKKIVKHLLNSGALINARDNRNRTPLALAIVYQKETEITEFLQAKGGKI